MGKLRKIARNSFLTILAGASIVAGAFLNSDYQRQKDYKQDKETVFNWIKNNPYIYNYEENYCPNSVGTLIHLRQLHRIPLIYDLSNISNEKKTKIMGVQTNIYNLINGYLASQRNAMVMVETITEKTSLEELFVKSTLDDTIKILEGMPKKSIVDIKLILPLPPNSEKDKKRYEKELEEYNKKLDKYSIEVKKEEEAAKKRTEKIEINSWYNLGAIRALVLNTNIVLLPGISYELQRRAIGRLIDIVKSNKNEEVRNALLKDRLMMDEREDYSIKLVDRTFSRKKRVLFIIYGGAHNFRDNIEKWNRNNPSRKMSLITITPKDYEE